MLSENHRNFRDQLSVFVLILTTDWLPAITGLGVSKDVFGMVFGADLGRPFTV